MKIPHWLSTLKEMASQFIEGLKKNNLSELKYITSITDRGIIDGVSITESWRQSFIDRMKEWNMILPNSKGGSFYLDSRIHDKIHLGKYAFFTEEEARDFLGDTSWLYPAPCPFIGKVVGYFAWWYFPYYTDNKYTEVDSQGKIKERDPISDYMDFNEVACVVMKEGRGVIGDIKKRTTMPAVILKKYNKLSFMSFSKYDFNDGDELLIKDEGVYRDYLYQQAEKILIPIGLHPSGVTFTSHNPLQMIYLDHRPYVWECLDEAERKRIDELFRGVSFEIFVYNLDGLEDKNFWYELNEEINHT